MIGVDRQIDVDDLGDVLDIETARRHVGRHQDRRLAASEGVQGGGALALVEVARERAHREAEFGEGVGQTSGVHSGANEDQGLGVGLHEEDVDQRRQPLISGATTMVV